MKKQPHTTMYEVNDSKREYEYSGESYIPSFVAFVESLGFEIKQTYEGSEEIEINGRRLHIYTGNASYMSRNAYTRERKPRKPVNRFISITTGGMDAKTVIKVHFNKELFAPKLRANIAKALAEMDKREADIEKWHEQERDNTIAVAEHYLQDCMVKEATDMLLIERGTIHFHLKDDGVYFVINSNNTIKSITYHPNEMKSMDELQALQNNIPGIITRFWLVVLYIINREQLPAKYIEWIATAQHKHYYTKTKSTEWKIE